MSNANTLCKNCELQFDETFHFCPHCGQKSKDKLTVGVLFSNTIKNYFSVDARFFKSFLPLLFKPGYLAAKFVEGKRLLYLHPAQLYLFSSILFFFFFSFKVSNQERTIRDSLNSENNIRQRIDSLGAALEKDTVASTIFISTMKKNQKSIGLADDELAKLDSIVNRKGSKNEDFVSFGFNEKKIDSLLANNTSDELIIKEMGLKKDDGYFTQKIYAQLLKLYKDKGSSANLLHSFYDTIPVAMFILLPIFAFILKILFFNKGPFAYHLVFAFYYFSYLFSTFIILLLASFIWEKFPGMLQGTIILSTFIYLCFAIKKFYKQSLFLSFIKSSVATLIYFLFVIPIAIILIGAFAFLFY